MEPELVDLDANKATRLMMFLDGYLRPIFELSSRFVTSHRCRLTDMVIEAMRPASPELIPIITQPCCPRLEYDASSRRTFILADDDLLVIDETVSNPIVHVESISATEIEVIQSEDLLVALSTDGNVHYYRLSNLEYLSSHF